MSQAPLTRAPPVIAPCPTRRALLLAPSLAPLGCAAPWPPAELADTGADTGPDWDPIAFFAGRTRSLGYFEDRFGAPTGRFGVDGVGSVGADGALALRQIVRLAGEPPFERVWRLERRGDGYVVGGPAVRGEGRGSVRGRVLRLAYTEALPPGGWRRTVAFDHWMIVSEDARTVVNRFVIRKLGIAIARATEVFAKLEP